MSDKKPGRDYGIDALRGLAIVAMVASHLAREILATPHPLALRVYGSLAAPLFITLAGMLVAQTAARKHHPLGYYLERGAIILLLAALVDVLLWGLYPFIGYDVLYLIGLAVPLTALFGQLRPVTQTGLLVTLLGVSALLRHLLGYPDTVAAATLSDSPREALALVPRAVSQLLVSGWFPLLPWVFFSFLGVRLYQWRSTGSSNFAWHLVRVGVPLVLLGMVCFWISPVAIYERGGYSELFYPPSLAFVLVAGGAVLLIFSLAGWSWLKNCRPLIQLGQCSLLMYIAHLALIHWGLRPLLPEVQLPLYFLLYAGILLALVGLAGLVELFKRRSDRPLPFMLRFLLGS